jgi:F-type H+-transporting ATPase subunit gamma
VVGGKIDFSVASTSGQKMIDSFLDGAVDEVYLIYSQFETMAKQIPTLKQVLPIPSLEEVAKGTEETAAEGEFLPEHICEPSSDALLGEMLPKNIFIQIYDALLQTSTSEHAARMRAMENATKACEDMVNELQTIFNKTRQAGITSDLMDIVGGAEALKG